jgi:hypothetical protein
LNYGVQKNDPKLEEFISNLIDIACFAIPKMYAKATNATQRDGALKDIESIKANLVQFIIEDLFTKGKEKLSQLTFEDMNKKFEDYRYVK